MKETDLTTIYVTRHGESAGNAEGILQGQLDLPLTDLGVEQARQTAKELKDLKFDAAFSSDLIRAKKTADIIAIEHDLVVATTEALRERMYGSLQGKGKDKNNQEMNKLFNDWNELADKEWLAHRVVEDAETGEEMIARLLIFLREIGVAYKGKKVLVVCHGDLMRTLLVHMGWVTHIELRGNTISNAGYIILETDGVDFFIKDTKGIKKNEGTEFSWGKQGRS